MAMVAFVRHRNGDPPLLRQFGPKPEPGHDVCPACGSEIQVGDYTTLIPIGPGADLDEQEKAALGRYYSAVAVEAHYVCVLGKDPALSDRAGRPVFYRPR